MKKRFFASQCDEGEAFDMTPVIDVVFLLIIFFMLVCQFIAADRFKVDVPEPIASAEEPHGGQDTLTLTVMPDAGGGAVYAAGAERLAVEDTHDVTLLITAAIDDYYRRRPDDGAKIVRLRCDKTVTFGQVKPVLKGIAESIADEVDWAVVRD